MPQDPTMSEAEHVCALLEENLKLTRKVLANSEKTRRYIVWAQIGGFIKLALVIVPLIVGYFLIKPYLTTALGTYRDLLGLTQGGSSATGTPDAAANPLYGKLQGAGLLKSLTPEQQKALQEYLK